MSSLSAASAAASSLSSGRLSVTGLASGLDVDKILTGLLNIEQKRLEKLSASRTRVEEQQAAFKGIEAKLLALQGQLFQLGRAQSNAFDLRSVTSSDEKLVSAAASSAALPGLYQLRVNSLAQSHQVASQGFASASAAITQGTLDIRVGSAATTTITIDSSNNTLQGLASAINNAGLGVTAMILQDGSASPARLLLAATKSGAANAITVVNNLAADGGGATRPVFDQSTIGAAATSVHYTGTSTPTSNSGAGAFTGTANNAYTFTVLSGGTVGVDSGLQVAYTDAAGANTGTITLNAGDVDLFQTVAQGIQVKFSAGTLIAGQTFSINATVPTVQTAADASVTIGSGAGAITIASPSNQIDNLYPGLSIDLLGADPARIVSLHVENNGDRSREAIDGFVKAFNDVMDFIDEQTKYDPETNQAATLQANRQATALRDQLLDMAIRPVAGLPTHINRLSAVGITISDKGRLVVNDAKLDDALSGRLPGIAQEDVRRLFALAGKAANPGIEFITGAFKTRASATPYQVHISQAAEQASVQAAGALAASTVLTTANNSFTIQVDGSTAATIILTPGAYSRLALAREIEAQIDGNSALLGRGVAVSVDGDRLVIRSDSHGAASTVTLGGGSALGALGFSGGETDTGLDVAGHFLVGGVVESATGVGQTLQGAAGNASTEGLQLRVTLTPAQVGAGLTSDLTVTRGVASALDATLAGMIDPITGRLKTINDAFAEKLDDIQKTIDRHNLAAQQRREQLLQQFVNLERTVGQLQSLGNFLTTQLAQITPLGAQNARR